MKTLLALLFFTGCVYAQAPTKSIRRDSLPRIFPPDIDASDHMPNARPNNSFYRNPTDPKNVVRATLDNMPIKVPDSSVSYVIGQKYRLRPSPVQPPMQFLKPMPRIIPKRFR